MHHAEKVGGDKEVALLETPGGDFKIQTREHEYPLDASVQKAQIQPDDIKRISNLEDAGIRGGIHSRRTYLMALHDGSLWIWKQTGAEERDEIFVYELAKAMFRAIVPEVQPVFVPKLGWGSAMRKVSGVPAGRVDGLHGYFHGNDEMMADLAAMIVLDYMTGNPDRHANNWFIMHNDRLAAIDNGWAGEDLTMPFSEVFQPARLAGMMEDERLWPQLLGDIAALIQDLSGRGDEVRALAESIGINKREAVTMVQLWEPKLESLVRLLRAESSKFEKARVYVETPEEVPPGAQMETGPRGGTYYESEPQLPGFEETPEQRARREIAPRSILDTGDDEERQKLALDRTEDRKVNEVLEAQPEYQGYSKATAQVRGAVKNVIATRINEVTGIPYNIVNNYISAWAGSSSDGNAFSLAMQMAAVELFDLPPTPFVEDAWKTHGGRGSMGDPGGPDTARERLDQAKAILQAMYDDTQKYLEDLGIESLVLYRGQRWFDDVGDNQTPHEISEYSPDAERLAPGVWRQEMDFHSNPLSSWAYSIEKAQDFANYSPEGADEYGEEDWDTAEEEAKEQLRSLWEDEARLEGLDPDDEEAYAEWEEKELDAYGGSIYEWASEHDIQPEVSMPSMTRAVSVIEVPRQKVIATALTGLGCLEEHEVIVTGGKFRQMTYSISAYSRDDLFPHATDIEKWESEQTQEGIARDILNSLVAEKESAFGRSLHEDELVQLKHQANEEATSMMAETKARERRRKDVEEYAHTEEAAPEKPGEIPDEVLEERLEDIRKQASILGAQGAYDKMTTLLFEWWTRKEEKWRKAEREINDDESLSEDEKVIRTAAVWLDSSKHSIDYKRRLDQARENVGYEPDWVNPVKDKIDYAYQEDRIKLLQDVVDGKVDADGFYKKQNALFKRSAVQEEIHKLGYDPFDKKLIGLYTKYKDASDAVTNSQWAGPGAYFGRYIEDWNDYYKYKNKRLEQLNSVWRKKIAAFPRVEKALAKARVYLKPGQQPPEGQQVHEGPRGGRYYDTTGRAREDDMGTGAPLRPDEDSLATFVKLEERYEQASRNFSQAAGLPPYSWGSQETRSLLKETVVKDIAEKTGIEEDEVNEFIRSWAQSSSDNNIYSLAMQMSAATMFGGKPSEFIMDLWDKQPRQLVHWKHSKEKLLDSADHILRYTYQQTQEWLKKRGIGKMPLGRGQGWGSEEVPNELAYEPDAAWKEIRKKADDLINKQNALMRQKIETLKEEYADTIHAIGEATEGAEGEEWEELQARYREYAEKEEKLYNEFDYNRGRINRWANMAMGKYDQWDGEVEFEQNPLSSWSLRHETARQFATMRVDHPTDIVVTMWAEVPAERIISTPFTGPGCLTEFEFLLAGGKMPVYYRAAAVHRETRSGAAMSVTNEHLNPYTRLEREVEEKRRRAVMHSKHMNALGTLHDQGKVDNWEAKALEEALLSGDKTAEEKAKQTIWELSKKAGIDKPLEEKKPTPAEQTDTILDVMTQGYMEEKVAYAMTSSLTSANPFRAGKASLILENFLSRLGLGARPPMTKEKDVHLREELHNKAYTMMAHDLINAHTYADLYGKIKNGDPNSIVDVELYLDDIERQNAEKLHGSEALGYHIPPAGQPMKALQKTRTYLGPGEYAPEGTAEETGPRGGRYYESEGRKSGLASLTAPRARRLTPNDVRLVLSQVRDYARAVKEMAKNAKHYKPEEEVPVYGEGGKVIYTVPEPILSGITEEWQKTRSYAKHRVVQTISERTKRPYEQVNAFVKAWAGSATDNNPESLAMQYAAAELFGINMTSYTRDNLSEALKRGAWDRIVSTLNEKVYALAEQEGKTITSAQNEVYYSKEAKQLMAEAKEEILATARDIVREMYQQTQQWLAERGIKKMVLFRGMRFLSPEYKTEPGTVGSGLTPIPEEMLPDDQKIRRDALRASSVDKPWTADKVAWTKNVQMQLNPMSSFSVDPHVAWSFAGGDYRIRTLSIIEVPAERIVSLPFTGAGCLAEAEIIVAGGESEMMVVGNAGQSVDTPPGFTEDMAWNGFASRLDEEDQKYRQLAEPYQ